VPSRKEPFCLLFLRRVGGCSGAGASLLGANQDGPADCCGLAGARRGAGGLDKTKIANYLEDWEKDAIKHKLKSNEFKLLEKYKNLVFLDDDVDGVAKLYKIWPRNLEWKTKDKRNKETPCYCILAKEIDIGAQHTGIFGDVDGMDDDDDLDLENYHISDALHATMRDPRAVQERKIELAPRG